MFVCYTIFIFISEDVDDPGVVNTVSFQKRSRGRPTRDAADALAKATKDLAAHKRRTRERDAEEEEREFQMEQERQTRLQEWLNHDQVGVGYCVYVLFNPYLCLVLFSFRGCSQMSGTMFLESS